MKPMLAQPYFSELMQFNDKQDATPTSEEARHRYAFYRRKGYLPDTARRFALAYEKNMAEQKARRIDHETGAV